MLAKSPVKLLNCPYFLGTQAQRGPQPDTLAVPAFPRGAHFPGPSPAGKHSTALSPQRPLLEGRSGCPHRSGEGAEPAPRTMPSAAPGHLPRGPHGLSREQSLGTSPNSTDLVSQSPRALCGTPGLGPWHSPFSRPRFLGLFQGSACSHLQLLHLFPRADSTSASSGTAQVLSHSRPGFSCVPAASWPSWETATGALSTHQSVFAFSPSGAKSIQSTVLVLAP